MAHVPSTLLDSRGFLLSICRQARWGKLHPQCRCVWESCWDTPHPHTSPPTRPAAALPGLPDRCLLQPHLRHSRHFPSVGASLPAGHLCICPGCSWQRLVHTGTQTPPLHRGHATPTQSDGRFCNPGAGALCHARGGGGRHWFKKTKRSPAPHRAESQDRRMMEGWAVGPASWQSWDAPSQGPGLRTHPPASPAPCAA